MCGLKGIIPIEEGSLAELSAKYLAHCQSVTNMNHGPASLRHEDVECGFINSRGEVYLAQPNARLVWPK